MTGVTGFLRRAMTCNAMQNADPLFDAQGYGQSVFQAIYHELEHTMTNLTSTTDAGPITSHAGFLAAEIRRRKYLRFGADVLDPARLHDLALVQDSYAGLPDDPAPGNRQRTHSHYSRQPGGDWVLGTARGYSQPAKTNPDAKGEVRVYDPIATHVLNSSTVQHLLAFHAELAKQVEPALFDGAVVADLHCVRYRACMQKGPAFARPVWLHSDVPEHYVAVILLGLSGNSIGADNIIQQGKFPTDVLRLQNVLETLVLWNRVKHAVTPLGTFDLNPATRDILLATFRKA